MPYHNPIPKPALDKRPQSGTSGVLGAWVQAEKLLQIALMLPSAAFVGWLAGYGLDRWLHQSWIGVSGAIFGIIAGLVGAVRTAVAYGAGSKEGNEDENGKKPGSPGAAP